MACAHHRRDADVVKERFERIYARARDHEAEKIPILVVLPDKVALVHRAEQRELSIGLREVVLLKSMAHIPVALVTLLHGTTLHPLSALQREETRHLCAATDGLMEAVSTLREARAPSKAVGKVAERILPPTRAFLERLNSMTPCDERDLSSWLGVLAGGLEECIQLATDLQLQELDQAVRRLLQALAKDDLRNLQAVVAGAHQARIRSLPMQYLGTIFRESPGAELRVSYGEAIGTVKEAVALIGIKRIDLVLANAFFGDPRRLQADVLGDAAEARLAQLSFAPIPGLVSA